MLWICCPGRAVRQVRHGSTAPQDFHSKYGTGLMIGGAVFCVSVWSYVSNALLLVSILFAISGSSGICNKVSLLSVSLQVLTQTGITWNMSPVGKVMPKEWREAEEWRATMRPTNQLNCCTDEWWISACSDSKTMRLFQHVSLFNKLNMILLLIEFIFVCCGSELVIDLTYINVTIRRFLVS